MDEFPKALTNADGEQIIVDGPDAEAAANKHGWFFGGPAAKVDDAPKPARKRKAG